MEGSQEDAVSEHGEEPTQDARWWWWWLWCNESSEIFWMMWNSSYLLQFKCWCATCSGGPSRQGCTIFCCVTILLCLIVQLKTGSGLRTRGWWCRFLLTSRPVQPRMQHLWQSGIQGVCWLQIITIDDVPKDEMKWNRVVMCYDFLST